MAKTRQPADKIVLREILAEVRAIRAVLEPEAPVDTGPVGPGRYGAARGLQDAPQPTPAGALDQGDWGDGEW